jgi:predicted DNA-binding transcriptional regulator YafY
MKSLAKAERLLHLLQTLRRHRYPVTGKDLAEELGVSLRTLYRDIAALSAQGAHIDGSPGIGYLLRPGFLLPPLMLTQEEIEALVLGSRWVSRNGDEDLQAAAQDLLAKIESILPAELRQEIASSGLMIGPQRDRPMPDRELALLRKAIRMQRKVQMHYVDLSGEQTRRTVWPFALAWFDRSLLLAAWCELRQGYRHFRTDRIREFALNDAYPRSRTALLQEWQAQMGIPPAASRHRAGTKPGPAPDTADRI